MTQLEINEAPDGKRKWEEQLLLALSNHTRFNEIVKELAKLFAGCHVDKVACFEALGFPLGAGVAHVLKAGLVLVRKTDPASVTSTFITKSFIDSDKKQKTFKIPRLAVPRGSRILIVDDLYERGEQLRAATTLLTDLGATVVGAAFICCRRSENVNLDACYGFRVCDLSDTHIPTQMFDTWQALQVTDIIRAAPG